MTATQKQIEIVDTPDFFTGISVTIDQTNDDILVELPKRLIRIATAHRAKNATALKLAYEDLSRFLGGMRGVADSVVRSTITHINRRPRA